MRFPGGVQWCGRRGLRRHGFSPRPRAVGQTLGRRKIRFSEGNRVRVFESGRDALAAMIDRIAKAKRFVHLETFVLRDDRIGRRFLDALAERAASGVDVRLVFDGFGSLGLGTHALEELVGAGGQIVVFDPLGRLFPRWIPRRHDHCKLLIVDGTIAFTGGLDIGDESAASRSDADRVPFWRDTHLQLEGPVVRDLSAVFLESWTRAGGPDLPWAEVLEPDPGRPGSVACGVLPDGPGYRRRAMRDFLLSSLRGVHDSARITTPYFAPDRGVLRGLRESSQRGVSIEILLAGRTDHPILRRGARARLAQLLEFGVEIYEYEAGILHGRSAVFDGRLAVVGTSNLDRQSLRRNCEINVVLLGGEVPPQLDGLFEEDLAASRRIDPAPLTTRGVVERAVDTAAALLARLT